MIFSSAELPSDLNDKARFNLWRDIYTAKIGAVEFDTSDGNPFQAKIEALPIGEITYATTVGTVNRVVRTPQHLHADTHDSYSLIITEAAGFGGNYRGNEIDVETGGAFLDGAERLDFRGADFCRWSNISVPKQLLHASFPKIVDKQGLPIAANTESLVLLRRYLTILEAGGAPTVPSLIQHVSTTLLDLVCMAVGAKGEDAELAGLRGVRAARLQAILDCIQKHYSNHAFTAQIVASELNLTPRYVHHILSETDRGFTDRVLELRLQRAKSMLGDPRFLTLRISDIALQSGFSDISYFNRCFKRRFGCSPMAAR
ncbi:AraC family transcriptional regulator [Shinella zoogloeoides]|nr:AraC family transcriptional regulator [Shinella zoogloeoides]UEX83756.1 AraC family transcriptional regulator [Shinella zoogloeoides]